MLPAWQDCVWCVDVVMGQQGDMGQTVIGWTARQRNLNFGLFLVHSRDGASTYDVI